MHAAYRSGWSASEEQASPQEPVGAAAADRLSGAANALTMASATPKQMKNHSDNESNRIIASPL
jgi:hypothetical protein